MQILKTIAGASVCLALMLPINLLAQKGSGGGGANGVGGGAVAGSGGGAANGGGGGGAAGGGGVAAGGGGGAVGGGGGGNGGGGKPAPPPQSLSLALSVSDQSGTSGTVNSDQPVSVLIQAFGDGKDAPVVTLVSGPAGLVLQAEAPFFGDNVPFGHLAASYTWTPSRADIGTAPSAVFKATTASGATVLRSVVLGPVVDTPPGVISGLTATRSGDRIIVQWNSNTTDPTVTFSVEGCYSTHFPGTKIPYFACDELSDLSSLGANVLGGTSANLGQPGVPANYYGIFVFAIGQPKSVLLGSATANVE